MEAEWSDPDTVKLIEMYEASPMLYDVCDANYRNKDLKRQRESEIATTLGKSGEF